ncbi:bile acid:sodium symporter family protein [Fibrella aquatilis]|uniref:Bile acid:sodium symporter family protein n=1 Tax=Fibrella aquatilis TaxID=2817059 RepID=A0A939G9X8_9BACT|nr:bile acid:sodium symporter family protein [Fibrella aquatilis]MBO0934516.1 bile acid:sodium symporter family protein [Fibrella aquatilis]
MQHLYKALLTCSAILGVLAIGILIVGNSLNTTGPFVIGALVCLAVGGRGIPAIGQLSFTIWVFAAVAVGLYYPHYFRQVGDFKLTRLIVPLIQLIMFTMGTEMSLRDFEGVVKTPKAVVIGLVSHFTIMPLVGFALARGFGFDPEIAAGIILIGSVPSGVTSNVLAFIAKANMPLSVTIATVSTLMAPLMTPLLMKLLAGQFVQIDFVAMMLHVVQIIIIPIVLGLVVNRLIRSGVQWLQTVMPVLSMVGVLMMLIVIVSSGRDALLNIGPLLFVASVIHHSIGYLLGYWSGRLMGLDEQTCRTISLEVGMQNGGLASGIALQMGKVATVGLASAISVPWMTISGSLLANWWRNQPIKEEAKLEQEVWT